MSRTEERNLILGMASETNWDAVRELFDHSGWEVSTNHPEAYYKFSNTHTSEGDRFVLLHNHPEDAIACAIVNGTPPEHARDAWLACANTMVDFFKRNRNQAVMVYIPGLLADPVSQLSEVAAKLELSDPNLPTLTFHAEQAPVLERLIANQLLQRTPGIDALLGQIEACTLPHTGPGYSAVAFDLNSASRELEMLRTNMTESETLAMSLDQEASQHSIANQQNQLKAELDDALVGLRNLDDRYRKLEEALTREEKAHVEERARNELLQSKVEEANITSRKYLTENSLLQEHLHLVQEELESKYIGYSQVQNQLAKSEAQRKSLRRSKQLAQNALEKVEKKHRQLEVSKEVEMSRALVKLNNAHDVNSQLESQLTAQKKLQEELEEHRDQQDSAIQVANEQIQRLQSDLSRLRSSYIFKATGPVRVLNAKLRRYSAKKAFKTQRKLIRRSGLFNEGWYLKTNPDVAKSGTDPVLHYLMYGAYERRNPSPEFNTELYLTSHPNLEKEGVNPLVHYFQCSQKDMDFYCQSSLPQLQTS